MGVGSTEPRVPVTFVAYGSESDDGFRGETGYPIPEAAKTQPNYIEGGEPGGGSDGDRHLLIVDRDRWVLYELFAAQWNASRGRWEAGSGAVFDLSSNGRRPEGWTSADAAGLAILPGLVRYDEARRGRINHALRVTVRATNGHVWPASHSAGSRSGALPMGARLRLKASKDLSPLPVLHSRHLPRDANLRAHRRRQRQRHVHHRRDGLAMEQRRTESRVPQPYCGRLRSDSARLAIDVSMSRRRDAEAQKTED